MRRRTTGNDRGFSRRALLVGAAGLAPAGRAARAPVGEQAVLDNLERRAREALASIRHARTAAEADEARPRLRRLLRESLGFEKLPWPPELGVRTVGELRERGYRIEKLVWETLPGVPVPAHLYLPEKLSGKAPAILFYTGHWWPDSKSRENFQAFCINMARLGFMVLTFDAFGQGERGVSRRDHRRTEFLPAGVSQQGLAEYETRCALEYLWSRPEVDRERIGMTGASGGGYNTWITAALDDRIRVAVPVVGTSDFYEQIHVCRPLDWYRAVEHCHFVPRLIRYADNYEFVAMTAPRPLLIVAALEDQSFPIEGVRKVYRYGREIYGAYGAAGKVAFYQDPAPHGYQQKKREAAYGWFLKWLMDRGAGGPFPEPATEPRRWDDPALRCFPPAENRPAGPGFVAMAERLAREVRPAGRQIDPETALGAAPRRQRFDSKLSAARRQRVTVPVEEDLAVPALLLRPEGEPRGLLVAADDRGKDEAAVSPFTREALREGWAVAAVDPRGIGEMAVTKRGWMFAVSLLLGENFVWRQAQDLLAVRDALGRGRGFALYARGHNAALAAAYAVAAGGQELRWFVLQDGFLTYHAFISRPASARASFQLFGAEDFRRDVYDREIPYHYVPFDVLRRFDLPQLLAAAGARGLVVNPIDGDWRQMVEGEARRWVPAGVELACRTGMAAAMQKFRRLLSSSA